MFYGHKWEQIFMLYCVLFSYSRNCEKLTENEQQLRLR